MYKIIQLNLRKKHNKIVPRHPITFVWKQIKKNQRAAASETQIVFRIEIKNKNNNNKRGRLLEWEKTSLRDVIKKYIYIWFLLAEGNPNTFAHFQTIFTSFPTLRSRLRTLDIYVFVLIVHIEIPTFKIQNIL